MYKKISLLVLTLTLVLTGCSQTTTQVAELQSPFEFEETEFDFGVIKQSGGVVYHDFEFTYTGTEPITISSTPGSCACTIGETDKREYQPGDKGILTVHFNPNLHAEPEGLFYKTVAIITEPKIDPLPEVKVWQEIDLDLGEEFFELQETHNNDDGHHDDETSEAEVPINTSNNFTLEAKELISELDDGLQYKYFTFEGTTPGPFLRTKVGEEVTVTLKNSEDNNNPHSIDLHAVNGPGGGGDLTQVFPGEEKSFTFEAKNPGIYVYHCATPDVAQHVANGMYGLILVEPKGGFTKVDREFYLMQGEFYPVLARGQKGTTQYSGTKASLEQPEYIVFNGKKNSLTGKNALQAKAGETIRLFVGNGGISKSSNLHVIGEIFDTVYPEGGTPVQNNIQTTLIPAGGATIVEFKIDKPGAYKIVDHALSRLSKGALAEIKVI